MSDELNPRFTFETFVVGAANRLAVTAARTVGESPGTAYNPLFIYGPSGLGKTHLLTAIGQLVRELQPGFRVEYLTLDEFVEQYEAAVAAGEIETWRRRFGEVDVLLTDDVQFLTHRGETQEELLRVIEVLQGANRQVVLTSDRPPAELESLDERLVTQFDGGLVVDIDAPEFETRLAILKRRSAERGVEFQGGVLEAVAGFEVQNVRELIGLLNRVIAFQAVSDQPLTPDTTEGLLVGEGRTLESVAGQPVTPAALPEDEFADFLSGVSRSVQVQVDAWRTRLNEAIARWRGEGYQTLRLDRALGQEVPTGIDALVREYEADVDRLRSAQRAMLRVDPERAEDPVFFDPDRVEEAEALVHEGLRDVRPPPRPSTVWTLDALVSGEANKVAMGAAQSVIAAPGTDYNPLVLVGPSGSGKTHLLHGIGNAIMRESETAVACLSAQQFFDELLEAIDADKVEAWRRRYRGVSALLIDDLHLLAGKERSQEELFHLLNAMFDAERQVVVTLPALPGDLEALEERIVSRLEGGLVVQLGVPDPAMRRLLVERAFAGLGRAPNPELTAYLAEAPGIGESVRQVLEGVERVVGAAATRGVEPSVDLGRELLERFVPIRPRPSVGLRTSGVLSSPFLTVRSREKVVWDWPDTPARIIEELA